MDELEYSIFDKWPLGLRLFNPFCIGGLIATFYVLEASPNQPGTFLYFTLPLIYAICCFIFFDIFSYQKGGFGLKVFYVIATCRYVLLPVLTCMVGHFTTSSNSSVSYFYAIIMTDVELIVSCIVVKYIYPRQYDKIKYDMSIKEEYYDDIGIGGLVVVSLSFVLIAYRGLNTLLSSMRFGVISNKLSDEAVYAYDIWLAHTLLAFGVVVVTSYFHKRNEKHESFLNIIIPVIFVALSCMMIFGNNRMMIVYYALSGLTVLFKAFPKHKKIFIISVVPIFLIVMISFTMIKQFSVDVTASSSETVGVEQLVSTLTSYICGIENVAKTYDLYAVSGNKMQVGTIFSDIVHNTKILGLPVLNRIPAMLSNIPTSVDLATTGTEMVSVCGQTLFYGGYVTGWLLDIVAYGIIVRLIVIFDINAKLSKSLGRTYLCNWLAVLFGMTMCYCLETLYAGVSYVPFFTWIFLKVNSYIRMRWTPIIREEFIEYEDDIE